MLCQEGSLLCTIGFTCGHHGVMTGQFLSGHIAVKQVEGKTFRPQRSSSVTILYCNWWRPSRSKRLTFNLFYCYVSAQELPSRTFAVAMSLYQITMYVYTYVYDRVHVWALYYHVYGVRGACIYVLCQANDEWILHMLHHNTPYVHTNFHIIIMHDHNKIQELGYVVMKQYEININI